MSDHSTHFEASGGGMVLTNAILLYRNEAPRNPRPYGAPANDAPAFATIHSVERDDEGQATIAAGVSLSRAHLRQWTQALGRTFVPDILPDNVMVSHPDVIAWWIPAQVRPAYFALTAPPAGLRLLAVRTIVQVPYPAHLFVATRSGLGVYALPANTRPGADTRLLHSPILNVFINGQLCWGNIPKPKMLHLSSIAEYESAVFDSWSTHPNPGQELTVRGKSGLVRLWDDLASRQARQFPVKRLRPFGETTVKQARRAGGTYAVADMTVGRLIALSARS